MPTATKKLLFLAASATSLGAVVVVCVILATKEWVSTNVMCRRAGANNSINGSIDMQYGLFEGFGSDGCVFGANKQFQVTNFLSSSSNLQGVHVIVILSLIICLVCCTASSITTFNNIGRNPSETFCGPIGVYTWNGISSILSTLAMVLFALNTELNGLSLHLAKEHTKHLEDLLLHSATDSYGYSFWITFVVIALNIITICIAFAYEHRSYNRKQEQQIPIENAPRDVLMY
ncbi:clarin-3 [Protopterus annectens]|uniref:clarin-3 n=1 Tax=Protopterus annectens TaxID=7888 RepID=UPI001CF99C66|nr:clarin-3 [Protopterus annectens]